MGGAYEYPIYQSILSKALDPLHTNIIRNLDQSYLVDATHNSRTRNHISKHSSYCTKKLLVVQRMLGEPIAKTKEIVISTVRAVNTGIV